MKNINRLLAAAAIFLSAAACHTSEIENPGHTDPVNPDPGTPDESGLTISASIVKTRVTYSDIDADLDQEWEVGDILFGYYDKKATNKVILKVDCFDDYGDAILKPVNVDGVASLSALAKLGDDVPVDLVYTGKNVGDYVSESDVVYPFDAGGNLTIDMNPKAGFQDGVNIPACMHARAYVETDTNDQDKKSLFFTFVNDCAIIEIYSLTGIKENIELQSDVALTSLSVSNLVLKGKYTLGTEGFEFGASEIVDGYDDVPVVTDYVYKFGDNDDWKVNSNAEIRKGNTQNRYLIAVVPNKYTTYITEDGLDESGIKVSATIGDDSYSFCYGQHDFEAGKCYVIHEADVVAKTVDGLYFTTVAAAFDHAATLNVSNNIVTLVKESIVGLGEHPSPTKAYDEYGDDYYDSSLEIIINYPVTLDLNGCTLSLSGSKEWNLNDIDNEDDDELISDATECFSVSNGGKFTITDSKGPNSEGIYSGTITSSSDTHMIKSKSGSQITINGGSFEHTNEWCIVSNYGELNVLAGDLSSNYAVVDNYGTLIVSEENNLRKVNMVSKPISGDYATVYNSEAAEITIYDGTTIEGTNGATIYNYRGTINIWGGSISSDNTNAIDSRMYEYEDDDSIKGGLISNDTGYKFLPKVNIYHGTLTTTSGAAVIQNEGYVKLANNNDITISGGNCHAIINNCILEINNGTISSNGFTPTEQEDNAEDAGEYRAAIFSLDNFPTDTYPCETIIKGGIITSETTDAIYIASADENYSGQKFTFSMTGGDIEGETYGINFFSYDSKSDSITFPESYQKNTEGTEITFTNGSIKGGTSAINGYSLP